MLNHSIWAITLPYALNQEDFIVSLIHYDLSFAGHCRIAHRQDPLGLHRKTWHSNPHFTIGKTDTRPERPFEQLESIMVGTKTQTHVLCLVYILLVWTNSQLIFWAWKRTATPIFHTNLWRASSLQLPRKTISEMYQQGNLPWFETLPLRAGNTKQIWTITPIPPLDYR